MNEHNDPIYFDDYLNSDELADWLRSNQTDDPLSPNAKELADWLESMQRPEDFAGFEDKHTPKDRVDAYRSLSPDTIARIKPLIVAYKAR